MDVRISNEKTRTFWDRACTAIKFEKDGMWGLKSPSGDIVLPAEYDKVEVCSDFVYVHYDNRHKYFYKNGSTSDCADREDDDRFYENGKIGILHQDGSIFLPAIYDEIIDWGRDSDVVYVRSGKEYHYFNHNCEEILTDVRIIPEDAYPECPYNLGEDQNREVLVCVEPIKEREDNRSCFTYGQWCRLSRIPRKDIRAMFADCKILAVNEEIVRDFYSDFTYIYSARYMKSSSLMGSVNRFKDLGCYDSSWSYLVKICVNHNTLIDPKDLYKAIQHFENLYSMYHMSFAIDYDDSLCDGEISMFQVHYYREGAYPNEYIEDIISNGSLNDVMAGYEGQEHKEVVWDDAFYELEYSENRSWEETERVMDYLYSVGVTNVNIIMRHHIYLNPFWIEEITPEKWEFKKNIITWAMKHGAQINIIKRGKTLAEEFESDLSDSKRYKENEPEAQESIKNAEIFLDWLKSIGAVSASEQRMKVKSKLDGLSPKAVFKFVSTI